MKQPSKKVSKVVVRRLPRYYRYLADLKNDGIERISSMELAKKMNVTASQIRQDFNCFGGFGQQGYGYNVEQLYLAIGDILGLNHGHKTVIIGAGNLGHALANYAGLKKRGFKVVGIFDNDPEKIGRKIGDIEISDVCGIVEFINENKIDIAILTLPKSATEEVAEKLIKSGIKGLWNFSFTELCANDSVFVENVHLTDSLMTLSFKMSQKDKKRN